MAKHKGAYNAEKRMKELKRLKKQEEKRQQRLEKNAQPETQAAGEEQKED